MTENGAATSTINNTQKSLTNYPVYGLVPKNLTACLFVIKSCKTSALTYESADNPVTTKNR
jgi:hypothetical protein